MKRIIINNIWKKFNIGTQIKKSLLERIISLFSGREPRRIIWALKNISISINAGESVGIIGKNGSGKSTLLRIIARIYKSDKGTITTNGKIISLLSFENGLDYRATAKDNIYLCCAILGLKQKEVRKKFKAIISFAELEKFVNTKLYQFSTGMVARLIFSIAIHSIAHKNPEILLLDEFLNVGDEHFKNKCIKKIKELLKEGTTVLLATHNKELLSKYCDRIIWIDNGVIRKDGKKEVLEEYFKYIK